MNRPESPSPADRAVAFLGLVLVTAGLFGGVAGISEATRSALPPPAVLVSEPTPAEATEALEAKLNEVLFRGRFRQALGATNAVISGLLLVSGVMLLGRRSTSAWLAFQGVVAKLLWTAADGASQAWTLWSAQGELRAYVDGVQAAASGENKSAATGIEPGYTVAAVLAAVLFSALVQFAFFAWMAWRLRRADIRQATGAPPR